MNDRKPNWKVWGNVPTVKILEAVALSLDIEPREIKYYSDAFPGQRKIKKRPPVGWINDGGPELEEGQEFLDRLEIAKRTISRFKPLKPTFSPGPIHDYWEVSVPAFGQWAKSIGWKLPEEFPCPEEKGKLPAERDTLSERERSSLYKIIIGMAVRGYKYNPDAARNEAVTDIVKDLEAAGVQVSDETVRKYLKSASKLLPGDPHKT